jgi:hypothetical protein
MAVLDGRLTERSAMNDLLWTALTLLSGAWVAQIALFLLSYRAAVLAEDVSHSGNP